MAAPRVNGNFKGTGKATAERQGQGQVQGQTTSGDAGREVRFDFERLRAYQLAAEFVVWADEQVKRHIRGRPHMADQLHRAATSIALNVAEGAGEFSPAEKARFYRIARRSATECAAAVDVLTRTRALDPAAAQRGRDLLHQIVSILVVMGKREGRVEDGADRRVARTKP